MATTTDEMRARVTELLSAALERNKWARECAADGARQWGLFTGQRARWTRRALRIRCVIVSPVKPLPLP